MLPLQRVRRTGSRYGQVWPLEGVKTPFALVAISLLLLTGIGILMMRTTLRLNMLTPVSIQLQAPIYHAQKGSDAGSWLFPVTGARILLLHPASAQVADMNRLAQLRAGDSLIAWLLHADAEAWNAGKGRKFAQVYLLQLQDGSWLIPLSAHRKASGREALVGYWLILFSLLLLPYVFIPQPRIPAWAMLLAYAIVFVAWLVWA